MKDNVKKTVWTVVISFMVFLALYGFYQLGKAVTSVEYDSVLADTTGYFETIINDKNQVIYSQVQRIGSLEQAVQSGIITQEQLKDRNMDQAEFILRLKNEIKLKDLEAQYIPDTVYVYDTITVGGNSYLRVPIIFMSEFDDEWASI